MYLNHNLFEDNTMFQKSDYTKASDIYGISTFEIFVKKNCTLLNDNRN